MRRVCYGVAMSLDGCIAGPHGEADWIVMDPDIDFSEIWGRYDTLLMGRRTYEAALAMGGGGGGSSQGLTTVVVSRTLAPEDHPGVTVISSDLGERVGAMRRAPGKDIWLFGGGELFRSLLALGLVDAVSTAIVPVVLGGGIRFLPDPAIRTRLRLTAHHVYPKSGIVSLDYDVVRKSQSRRRNPAAGS